jgi:hypothetical protein
MTKTQSKWEKIVPKRLENVVDALRKLARTGSKDYEPIPVEHAQEMVSIVQNAVGELVVAYAPYTGTPITPVAPEVEAPRPTAAPLAAAPKPVGDALNDPLKIARFVQQIPKDLLPAWSVHLCSRITDEFYEAFKKAKRSEE